MWLDPFCNQDIFLVSWIAREILSNFFLLLFLAIGKLTRVRFRLGFFSLKGDSLFFRVVVYRLCGELLEGGKLFRLGVRGGNAGFNPAPAPSLVPFLFSFFHRSHELLDLRLQPLDGLR